MKLYDEEFVANIKLESLEKPVQLAALELQKTLRALSGKPKGFVMTAVGQIVLAVAPGRCTVEVTDEAVRITAPEAEKMADALVAAYEVDKETAIRDTEAFLAPLRGAKLIEE